MVPRVAGSSPVIRPKWLWVMLTTIEIYMKLAIIIIAMWCLVLEFIVQSAERKSKTFEEERQRERERKARAREEWAKRYRK